MDEVESLFTEHYTNNDRKKAMKFLRPLHHKDSHVVTFFVGTIIMFAISVNKDLIQTNLNILAKTDFLYYRDRFIHR